jgi:hypothetical protein
MIGHHTLHRNHIDVMPIGFPYLYRLKALEVCCNDLKALPVELDKMISFTTVAGNSTMPLFVADNFCSLFIVPIFLGSSVNSLLFALIDSNVLSLHRDSVKLLIEFSDTSKCLRQPET